MGSSPFNLTPPYLKILHVIQEEISAAVEKERPLDEVAHRCLHVLLERTCVRGAAVYLEDEPTKELRCLTVGGRPVEGGSEEWDPIVTRVVRSGRLRVYRDRLGVPLTHRGIVSGVLAVRGLPKRKTDSGAMTVLLNAVGSRLGSAFDHARLVQKYAQKIERIQCLEEVTRVLVEPLNGQETLQQLLEAAIRLVDAEAGALLLQESGKGELLCVMAVGDQGAMPHDARLEVGKAMAGLVARTGKPLIVNDVQHDPRVNRELKLCSGVSGRNLLAVPVMARSVVIGVLEAMDRRHGKGFSQWDLDEFGSLSHQVGMALENTRLFRDTETKIARLKKSHEISAVLNSSLDQTEIRKRAIEAATILMDAEAGSLLLLDEAAGELYFEVALGEKGEGVREVRLKLGEGIAGYVAQTGEPVIVNDAQNDPRLARRADDRTGFVTRNMVCVPARARDRVLGVLQALNKKDGGSFGQEQLEDFVSLGHQVGIALENAALYEEINRLFEGFISASVLAIESRDPSTFGHSGRVATLCCGLAGVVDRVDDGPYAGISFSYDQMKEIRYAAVLHDFGKVGVRENVLVKGQKLFPGELERLKARFDFIKRTLEVQALQKKVDILMSSDRVEATALLAEVDAELARQVTETEEILEHLLTCNKPTVLKHGEFDRLHTIAQYTYDSYEGAKPFLMPQEIVALSIPIGTLTAEERAEIQSHVSHTYRFLSTIPWSKSLKNVPQIAYGHHEKLDGSGYPRQLTGVEIPVQSRIMTICDIYDALTACDRHYKAALPEPRALEILEAEVKGGKLDAALFEFFADAKVYRLVHKT